MSGRVFCRKIPSILLLILIFSWTACAGPQKPPEPEIPGPPIHSVAVLPFQAVLPKEGESVVRSPFGGATFLGGNVQEEATSDLDLRLRNELVGDSRMVFLSRTWTERLREQIRMETVLDREIMRRFLDEIREYTGADAAVMGHIYAYEDKIGSAYGVERPAYVAFDIHVIRLSTGEVLWRRSFSRRQKDLTQNILDVGDFFSAGGRWLSAGELAQLGFERIMKTFPLRDPVQGESR